MTGEEPNQGQDRKFVWTDAIKQSFREELEKLVILDYLMRNTDRGLDNWMVRVDENNQQVSIVSEPLKMNGNTEERTIPMVDENTEGTRQPSVSPYKRQEAMSATSRGVTPPGLTSSKGASISIGAIDNSLSWPWKHPDAVRSQNSSVHIHADK